MKKELITIGLLLIINSLTAQNVGINTTTPATSAALDITATDKGLLVPRMTTTQRTAIASPATGLLVYDNTLSAFYYYNGSAWVSLAADNLGNHTATQNLNIGSNYINNGTTNYGLQLDAFSNPTFTSQGNGFGATLGNQTNSDIYLNFRPTGNEWNIFANSTLLRMHEENSDVDPFVIESPTVDNLIYLKGTNVGIGTSTPSVKLDVSGTTSTTNLKITNGATNGYVLQSDASGNATWINPTSLTVGSATSQWTTSGSNIYKNNTANVGIGTTSPTELLHVSEGNAINSGTFGSSSTLTVNGAGTRSFFYPRKGAFRAGTVTGVQFDNANIGNYSFAVGYNAQASGIISNSLGFNNIASGSYSTAIGNGSTASNTGSFAVGLSNTASGIWATALGSGTTASGSYTSANNINTTAKSYAETVFGQYNTSYTPLSTTSWNTADRLFSIGNGTASGSTSDALTVLKSGNVGIGTSTPSVKLDISGTTSTTNLKMTSGATNGYVLQSDASGNGTWVNPTSLSNANWTISGTDQYAATSGNVGIGTSTPSVKLDVSGTTSTTNLKMTSGATNGYVLQSDASGNATWVAPTSLTVGSTIQTALKDADLNTKVEAEQSSNDDKVHFTLGGKEYYTMNKGTLEFNNTGGSVYIGNAAGQTDTYSITTNNVGIGANALQKATNGSATENTGIGNRAIQNLTTGTNNVALGSQAMRYGNGDNNTAIGSYAGNSTNTTGSGSNNVSIGNGAGSVVSGSNNTFIGTAAGGNTISGGNNVMLGLSAGEQVYSGSSNVFIGYQAAQAATSTTSNKLYIENSNSETPLIWGDFSNDYVNINGKLGVNNSAPSERLDVVGKTKTTTFQMTNGATNTYILQSDANGNGTWVSPTTVSNSNWTTSGTNQYNSLSGNVGIGTTTPSVKLDIQSSASTTASVQSSASTAYMRVVSPSAQESGFSFNTYSSGSALSRWLFGKSSTSESGSNAGSDFFINRYDDAGTYLGQPFRITRSTGYVGIGTGSPSYPLHVASSANQMLTLDGSSNIGTWLTFKNSTTNAHDWAVFTGGSNTSEGTSSFFIKDVDASAIRMAITGNGYVGFNTYTPTKGWVEIGSSLVYPTTGTSFRYYNSSGVGSNSTSSSTNYSLYASDRIGASEFNAFSDRRIKNILRGSDSREDLATLMKLRITDYKMIDTIAKGTKVYKKVIAQEVDEVYPTAVSKSTDVIPDIYKVATIKDGFVRLENHNLKVSDRVQLIFGSKKDLYKVLEINTKGFKTDANTEGEVFVYGKEVNDFHTVDYEALSTLNISATQELVKQINELKAQNAALKSDNSSMKADIEALKAAVFKKAN
jgi:hypothetical protein